MKGNLVYKGITRAKKFCIIVGTTRALAAKAIEIS